MSYTYLEINDLHEEYSSQSSIEEFNEQRQYIKWSRVSLRARIPVLNLESATCQNLSTVFLSFLAYKMRIEIAPSS